jgi:hypothetical protein
MNEDRYLTYKFRQMLYRYQDDLRWKRHFLINENIELHTTDIGVLTLFVREMNKKGITKFYYRFIK